MVRLFYVDRLQPSLLDTPGVAELKPQRHPRARKGHPIFRPPVEEDLFPETLGARFNENDPVRLLLRALEKADLSAVLRSYDHRGGTPYHPRNLLAVVLFGMTKGVRSSRALEEACRFDVRFMFLMGGQTPDDRTFGRFLERLDGVAMDQLFQSVMRLAKPKGRLALVDGRKVAANTSWWKFREQGEITDPDAKVQKSHGRHVLGYNAQVLSDETTGLVMAAEVLSDQGDTRAMEPLLNALDRQSDAEPVAVIADAGYDCEPTITALEARGIDSVIAYNLRPSPSLRENDDDKVVCPAGRVLQPRGKEALKKKALYLQLRPGCQGCALGQGCAFRNKTMQVQVWADPGARIRNRERVESATYAGALIKRRKVERIFAQMVHDGFRAFQRRGRSKARTEFLLWALSYNLRIALTWLFLVIRTLFPAEFRVRVTAGAFLTPAPAGFRLRHSEMERRNRGRDALSVRVEQLYNEASREES